MKNNQNTKKTLLAILGTVGGVFAFKNRKHIVEKLDVTLKKISEYSDISKETLFKMLEISKDKDFNVVVNKISALLADTKIDLEKIQYEKLAENIYAWFIFANTYAKSTQDLLIKYSVWEIIGKETQKEKLDSLIYQMEETQKYIKQIKKPKTDDALDNIKYNFLTALKKQMNNKKEIKVLKEKAKTRKKVATKKPVKKKKTSTKKTTVKRGKK